MRIKRVELFNIRQFVGRQRVDLAVGRDKKVTLVHGPNTGGKTTLLNAIYWCLYGEFLEGFKEPSRLLSQDATELEYWVELEFEHAAKSYIVRRSGRNEPSKALLNILEMRSDGRQTPHPQPELLISSILPQGLAHFFFFAGEMIKDGLSSGDFEDPIRAVLGLKLAEQALADLTELRKKKNKELRQLSTGTQLEVLASELDEAEQYVESRREQLSALNRLVADLSSTKRELFQKLRGIESSADLQRRREKNEKQIEATKRDFTNALVARQEIVSQYGAAVFLEKVAQGVDEFINVAVTQKRIPSPFDKTFVEDILESEECVCGRPVCPGSDEYRAIASLVNSASDEATIRGALDVRAVAGEIKAGAETAKRSLKGSLEQYKQSQDRLEELEQEGARIREILQRHDQLHIRDLENQLEGVEGSLREFEANRQRTEEEIKERRERIASLRRDIGRIEAVSPQVDKAQHRLTFIDELIAELEGELERVELDGIKRISAALNDVVGRSTRQKYLAEVRRDYKIRLYTNTGGEKREVFVLSSGEQRLLDLCFVASLVSVCRQREGDKDAILLPGAIAPMIVDAPFGELDPEYQALAVSTIISLSEQVVLLLSKTHWTPQVDSVVRPQCGREYLMVGHRAEDPLDASPVEILINGRVHQQMIYAAADSRTEIKEVGPGYA